MRGCAAGDVARQLVVEAAHYLAVVVTATLEAEERAVLGGRYKVETAVEARIVCLGDVNLRKQCEEAIRVRCVAPLPAVEVIALNDLIAPARAIQFVDLL